MPVVTQTRKPRRKATTDLGKSILQRERQRLVREQAALAEKLAEDAVASRKAMQRLAKPNPVRDADKAVQRSIVKRIAGVLASEGVTPSIDTCVLPATMNVDAWTDFARIHVGYHVHDDVRLTAAVLRGLFYHEGGHCRFTVPFPTLTTMADDAGTYTGVPEGLTGRNLHHAWNALEDQRMETAVVSDSPRKAGYFVPMVLSELACDVNSAAANWPLLIWRRYLPSKVVAGARKLFVVQNGEHGERYARTAERIVDTYVQSTDPVEMWNAVVSMARLFQEITPLAFDLDKAGHRQMQQTAIPADPDALQIPIDPSMIPDFDFDFDDDGPVDPDAFDPEHLLAVIIAVWNAPETLLNIQYVVNLPADTEPQAGPGNTPAPQADDDDADEQEEEEEEEDEPQPKAKPSKAKQTLDPKPNVDDDEDDADEADDESADDNAAGANEADDESDESDDADDDQDDTGESTGTEGGASGKHEDDKAADAPTPADEPEDDLTDDDLNEAIADAEAERNADSALDADVRSFSEAQDDQASRLDIYNGGRSDDTVAIMEANNLAQEMEQAFKTATAPLAPAWHDQQRRGILNPLRYVTRDAGQVDFYKGYVDNGNPGCDIAVSLLLDYSYSMNDASEELAKVAFAAKAACDRLDIPCTVVLWDTDARVLWDAGEQAENLPVIDCTGGTNPRAALNDLDNHKFNKGKHLVMIMTDNDWTKESPLLSAYHQDGRTILCLGYDHGNDDDKIAASMRSKGAHEAYCITSLDQIPRYLEETLSVLA